MNPTLNSLLFFFRFEYETKAFLLIILSVMSCASRSSPCIFKRRARFISPKKRFFHLLQKGNSECVREMERDEFL